MTKQELVKIIADKAEISQAAAGKVITAFCDAVKDTLQQGDSLSIIGFGTFEVRDRAARKGHNPSTGEMIDIPACKVPAWKPSKAIKDLVNNR